MAYVLFLGISLVWGSSFILMKKALLAFGPISVGWLRILLGTVTLSALHLSRRGDWRLSRLDWPGLFFVASIGYAWPFAIQPYLVSRHGGALVGVLVSFTPILTILVAFVGYGQRATLRQLVGVVGGLVFVGLLLLDGWQRSAPIFDLALGVSVPCCYAITNTFIKRRLFHLAPLLLTTATLGLAAMLLAPLVALSSSEHLPNSEFLSRSLAAILFLGVVGTGLSNAAFTRLIRDEGPLFAGMVTYLVPIGALLWGWLDHETITPLQIGALVGVLVMVVLVQTGNR